MLGSALDSGFLRKRGLEEACQCEPRLLLMNLFSGRTGIWFHRSSDAKMPLSFSNSRVRTYRYNLLRVLWLSRTWSICSRFMVGFSGPGWVVLASMHNVVCLRTYFEDCCPLRACFVSRFLDKVAGKIELDC